MNVHRWMQADCARVVVRTFLAGERASQAKPVASSCVESRCDVVVEVKPIRFRPFRLPLPPQDGSCSRLHTPAHRTGLADLAASGSWWRLT